MSPGVRRSVVNCWKRANQILTSRPCVIGTEKTTALPRNTHNPGWRMRSGNFTSRHGLIEDSFVSFRIVQIKFDFLFKTLFPVNVILWFAFWYYLIFLQAEFSKRLKYFFCYGIFSFTGQLGLCWFLVNKWQIRVNEATCVPYVNFSPVTLHDSNLHQGNNCNAHLYQLIQVLFRDKNYLRNSSCCTIPITI